MPIFEQKWKIKEVTAQDAPEDESPVRSMLMFTRQINSAAPALQYAPVQHVTLRWHLTPPKY
jgi:hypothetical protein